MLKHATARTARMRRIWPKLLVAFLASSFLKQPREGGAHRQPVGALAQAPVECGPGAYWSFRDEAAHR